MEVHEYLSDDGHAVLALCSPFELAENSGDPAPYTLADWNTLAIQIRDSEFKSPAGLQGKSVEAIEAGLSVTLNEATRICRLLDRSSRMAMHLESVFSKGMWVLTRADAKYPARLRDTLKHQSPTVLFGAGEIRLVDMPGVAVVGSRNLDEIGSTFAKQIGKRIVRCGMSVVSGGARGTDRIAMEGAIEAGGKAVGALADSLEVTIRKPDVRQLLLDSQLVLLTCYAPNAGFSVGAAMGRNKIIYGLSEYAVIVSSDFQTGGTWAGGVSAIKSRWCPVFVRDGENVPTGNKELIKLGGIALPESEVPQMASLLEWMKQNGKTGPVDRELFDLPPPRRPRRR